MLGVAQPSDNGLVQRMRAAALDATMQVEAGETIGVRPPPSAATGEGDKSRAGKSGADNAEKTASADDTGHHSLPRISLGAIGSQAAPSAGSAASPDLRVLRILGEGGMGRVHLATQNSLRREVAVKTLKDGANRHAHAALLSEARVTGFLAHPGIIPVHSLGLDENDKPVLVMKRIEGVPWKELLDNPQSADWAHWESRSGDRLEVHLQILMKICDALHFAHSQRIIHRDIKPENVMLGLFGEVYLVDWGLALSLENEVANELVGTPAYMAPEMATGAAVDHRTDVYLLGASLHEVLTGNYLHTGTSLHQLLAHAASSAPFAYESTVPTELAELCAQATARDPSQRPQSAEEFRLALADYLSHRSSIAVSNAALERLAAAEATRADASMGPQERAHYLGSHCAEARFGFQEALRAWSGNEAARRGLQQSFALSVEAHLLRRDPIGALAQLQSMEEPPAALREKIDLLTSELDRELKERERLQHLDRELDQTTGFAARVGAFVLITVATAGMSIGLLVTGKGETLTNADTLIIVCLMLGVAGVVLTLKRRKLFANTFNKRLVAFAMISIVGMLINRLLGYQLETPVRQVLLGDMLLVAACTAMGGFTIIGWIKWMTPVLLAGAVVMALMPTWSAPTIFSTFDCLALLVGGLAWLVQARRKSAD